MFEQRYSQKSCRTGAICTESIDVYRWISRFKVEGPFTKHIWKHFRGSRVIRGKRGFEKADCRQRKGRKPDVEVV